MIIVQQLVLNRGRRCMWTTPAFEDVRFGFEVTMYINNR